MPPADTPAAGRGGGALAAAGARAPAARRPLLRVADARICLYVGDESRYQAYVRLGLEQKTRAGARDAAKQREAAALFTSARDWGFGWYTMTREEKQ